MAEHDGVDYGDRGVWGLSPEQATEQLAQLKREFDAANGAPAPTSPAGQRLKQMLDDPKTRDAYLTGHPSITREINELIGRRCRGQRRNRSDRRRIRSLSAIA